MGLWRRYRDCLGGSNEGRAVWAGGGGIGIAWVGLMKGELCGLVEEV